MSKDILSFIEAAKSDPTLLAKIKDLNDPVKAVAIAKEAGFVFTVEELKTFKLDLSEEELESMVGGAAVKAQSCYILTCF
ncbi:Nif11-like leader peptide family natural product precursor [Synechococcus sp. CBW1107]|uniref:Nif11-like leader peptide family natural product precursor n=1 Tax=Synechococcus sp. CBW1107 TaxID=2789857 RepID=UPI002AD47BD6|nr:Nif11-like leader peptide family natural product precursor [Synechococcus sp. CBW1107]